VSILLTAIVVIASMTNNPAVLATCKGAYFAIIVCALLVEVERFRLRNVRVLAPDNTGFYKL
jgi:hypothetical protein